MITGSWRIQGFIRLEVKRSVNESESGPHAVRKLAGKEIEAFLANRDHQWKLFPHGYIMMNWVPYRVMTSNFKLIRRNSDAMFASFCGHSSEAMSASMAESYQAKIGLLWVLDYYGGSYEDLVLHVKEHLRAAHTALGDRRLFINVFFPATMEGKAVAHHLQQLAAVTFCDEDTSKWSFYFARSPILRTTAMAKI